MMEKQGVDPSDLRASRELELRQIKARLGQLKTENKKRAETGQEKTAEDNAELNELTSRAEALEAALRADE